MERCVPGGDEIPLALRASAPYASGMTIDPTERFTDRAKDYAAFRPGYPREVFDLLLTKCPLPATAADIAAGTGIFTRGLEAVGYRTVAIEPNGDMRAAARASGLSVQEGTAESTGMPDESFDLITMAQAFHWIDTAAATAEFRRIAKRGATVAITWNSRLFEAHPFMGELRQMLEGVPGYNDSHHLRGKALEEAIVAFLGSGAERHAFPNPQRLDEEGVVGWLRSTSNFPRHGEPGHDESIAAARQLFARHQVIGNVTYALETIVYVARW